MSEEIKHDRRTFLRAGAISIAAASLGMMGSVIQQEDRCRDSITRRRRVPFARRRDGVAQFAAADGGRVAGESRSHRYSAPTPASTGYASFPMSAHGLRNARIKDWW